MTTQTITIPRPHVIYGPQHVTEDEADADYLRSAARNLRHLERRGQSAFGSNLTNTVVKLLEDAAAALERRAPVQSSPVDGGRPLPGGTISWVEHVEAHQAYRYGQSAERIAERGGFGRTELVALLGHEPTSFVPQNRTNEGSR